MINNEVRCTTAFHFIISNQTTWRHMVIYHAKHIQYIFKTWCNVLLDSAYISFLSAKLLSFTHEYNVVRSEKYFDVCSWLLFKVVKPMVQSNFIYSGFQTKVELRHFFLVVALFFSGKAHAVIRITKHPIFIMYAAYSWITTSLI